MEGNKELDAQQECLVDAMLNVPKFVEGGEGECYNQVFKKIMSVNSSTAIEQNMKYPFFTGFISPPTKSCFICHGKLTKHN